MFRIAAPTVRDDVDASWEAGLESKFGSEGTKSRINVFFKARQQIVSARTFPILAMFAQRIAGR